jgi:hypothetical protein
MLPVSRPSIGGWGSALQVADEFRTPRHDFAAVLRDVVEPENVMLEEPRNFPAWRDVVNAEKFADEADVGAPGELHFFRAVMQR